MHAMTKPNILVAGIGNIFLGDDAFGSEVARRLMDRAQPKGVRVVDFGIRGLDLTYALAEGCDAAILIDAMPRGGVPGTVYVLEPEIDAGESGATGPMLDAHSMNPMKVLSAVARMGGRIGKILIVGCEPTPVADDDFDTDMNMAMTPPVEAAIDEAIAVVELLIKKFLENDPAIPFTMPPQTSSAAGRTELSL
jgi:hydrogenase maturation protease